LESNASALGVFFRLPKLKRWTPEALAKLFLTLELEIRFFCSKIGFLKPRVFRVLQEPLQKKF
jgi:hypothetical protein